MEKIDWFDTKINNMRVILDDMEKEFNEFINSIKPKKEITKKERNLEDFIEDAPNFQYIEFVRSNTAKRYNLPNEPNEEQWNNIETLAINILQPLRNKFGPLRINSGFRSKDLNNKIRGSKTSYHCYGMAADIIPLEKNITNLDLLKHIYNDMKFSELIYEFPPNGWVHVGLDINNITKELRLKDNKHDYEEVSLDYIISGQYKRR